MKLSIYVTPTKPLFFITSIVIWYYFFLKENIKILILYFVWVLIRLVNHVKLSLKPTQTSRFCQHLRKTKLKTVHFLSTNTREFVNKSKFLLIKNRGMLQWIWYLNTNFYHILRIKAPNLFKNFGVLSKKPHTHKKK